MKDTLKTTRVPQEIQPSEKFQLMSIADFAKTIKKKTKEWIEGELVEVEKYGVTSARVYQMFQEGKIEIVQVSGIQFVKLDK